MSWISLHDMRFKAPVGVSRPRICAQRRFDLIGEMIAIGCNDFDSVGDQLVDDPMEDRSPIDRQHCLGDQTCQRAESITTAGG